MSAPRILKLPTDSDSGHASHDAQHLPPELEALVRAARELEKDHIALMRRYDALYRDYTQLQKQTAHTTANLDDQFRQAVQNAIGPAIESEKKRFRMMAAHLYKEVEYLRQVHPLKGMLMAKQAEMERLKKAMAQVPRGSAERAQIEQLVKAHVVERDQVRELLQATEERLVRQLASIEEAMEAKSAIASMGADLE